MSVCNLQAWSSFSDGDLTIVHTAAHMRLAAVVYFLMSIPQMKLALSITESTFPTVPWSVPFVEVLCVEYICMWGGIPTHARLQVERIFVLPQSTTLPLQIRTIQDPQYDRVFFAVIVNAVLQYVLSTWSTYSIYCTPYLLWSRFA